MDWVEPAAIVVTAAATVILAIVTYLAVKGGDRTAHAAERAAAAAMETAQAAARSADAAMKTLIVQTRPILVSAHLDDPSQDIVFHYDHILKPKVEGRKPAVFEDTGDSIYMGIALRNIGLGMALLYGWRVYPNALTSDILPGTFEDFTCMMRALHIPPGGLGYWQAQARERDRVVVREANATGRHITVDLLYGDEEGGQGRITRFHLRAVPALDEKGVRSCDVTNHWSIDGLKGNWPPQLLLEVSPGRREGGESIATDSQDVTRSIRSGH